MDRWCNDSDDNINDCDDSDDNINDSDDSDDNINDSDDYDDNINDCKAYKKGNGHPLMISLTEMETLGKLFSGAVLL